MHGYEMIQEIAERTDGVWKPSPGSVYPTLQLLVDEGVIVGTETEGSKKLSSSPRRAATPPEKIATRRGRRSPRASSRATATCGPRWATVQAVAQSAHTASPGNSSSASSTS